MFLPACAKSFGGMIANFLLSCCSSSQQTTWILRSPFGTEPSMFTIEQGTNSLFEPCWDACIWKRSLQMPQLIKEKCTLVESFAPTSCEWLAKAALTSPSSLFVDYHLPQVYDDLKQTQERHSFCRKLKGRSFQCAFGRLDQQEQEQCNLFYQLKWSLNCFSIMKSLEDTSLVELEFTPSCQFLGQQLNVWTRVHLSLSRFISPERTRSEELDAMALGAADPATGLLFLKFWNRQIIHLGSMFQCLNWKLGSIHTGRVTRRARATRSQTHCALCVSGICIKNNKVYPHRKQHHALQLGSDPIGACAAEQMTPLFTLRKFVKNAIQACQM